VQTLWQDIRFGVRVLTCSMASFGLALIAVVVLFDKPAVAQTLGTTHQQKRVTLRGRVVDARSGEPIAKVRVIANSIEQSTSTDEAGQFTLDSVLLGDLDLYITTVN
jgi:Carboxypeptidase regulatory-like domain